MSSIDEIFTVEAAASWLSLSDSAVYKLLQQGELPGGKVGGQWRLRRSDLDRAFDLARARAKAQQNEKEASDTWFVPLSTLRSRYKTADIQLTRCLWCPEWIPAFKGARFTTLCSTGCASELRHAYGTLGWQVTSDYYLSPIYGIDASDGTELMLGPWHYEAEMAGFAPDHELMEVRYRTLHSRGPLRELLLLEHPYLRDYNLLDRSIPADADSRTSRKAESRVGGEEGPNS